jgi:hypothetical protein
MIAEVKEAIDWTAIVTTFFSTLPMTITAIGGLIAVIRKLNVIHKATNSIVSQLVDKADQKGDAVGHARGVEDERTRADLHQGRRQGTDPKEPPT